MASSDTALSSAAGNRARLLWPAAPLSWLVAALGTAVSYAALSRGLAPSPGLTIPLFCGATAALWAGTPVQATLVAALTLAVAYPAAPPMVGSTGRFDIGLFALAVILAGASAAAVATVLALRPRRRKGTVVAVSIALVVCVLVGLWAPLFAGRGASASYGSLSASTLRSVPEPHAYVNDDELYRRVFFLMHRGETYYPAYRDAWLGLASRPKLPNSVTAYRLPTLFWIWRLLPSDPFAVVWLWVAFVTVGVVAASLIAGQLVDLRAGPLAAVALAGFAIGSGRTVYVTYVDLPATCLALAGLALFVRSRLTGGRRYLWAAAGLVLLAALTREIVAYVVVLAALSALLEPSGMRWRQAQPWLTALLVFAVAYATHTFALRNMVAVNSGALSYLHGGVSFAVDALTRFSDRMGGSGFTLVALVVLGLVGAIASGRRAGLPFAVFSAALIVVPLLVMLRVGNPGIDAAGNRINYWGNLFVPYALALWPAWMLVFSRRAAASGALDRDSAGPDEDAAPGRPTLPDATATHDG